MPTAIVDVLAGMAIARLPLIVVDCPDPGALAMFYGAMLDWKIDVSANRPSACAETASASPSIRWLVTRRRSHAHKHPAVVRRPVMSRAMPDTARCASQPRLPTVHRRDSAGEPFRWPIVDGLAAAGDSRTESPMMRSTRPCSV